jgi:hypothetical protein
MKTIQNLKNTKFMVSQLNHTSTSWIGRYNNEMNDTKRGQTFFSTADVAIQGIDIYTSLVLHPAKMTLTVHPFNHNTKTWGLPILSTSVYLQVSDSENWKSISTPGLHLYKGQYYGFRLECPQSLIGLGEAVGSNSMPLPINGQEWKFSNSDPKGQSYSFFSLAFKIAVSD